MSVVIIFDQLARLASQLPPADKRRLAKKLEKEASREEVSEEKPSAESQLTPSQRKTWRNIKQGFEELKQVREGTMQARPLKEFLDELIAEGYL